MFATSEKMANHLIRAIVATAKLVSGFPSTPIFITHNRLIKRQTMAVDWLVSTNGAALDSTERPPKKKNSEKLCPLL